MSNIIPPLLSDSPPPPPPLDDDEDDEFGDIYAGINDYTYTCDSSSLPESPFSTPKKQFDLPEDLPIPAETLDINRNTKSNKLENDNNDKDFQDRRKDIYDADEISALPNKSESNDGETSSIPNDASDSLDEKYLDSFDTPVENCVNDDISAPDENHDKNKQFACDYNTSLNLNNGDTLEQTKHNEILPERKLSNEHDQNIRQESVTETITKNTEDLINNISVNTITENNFMGANVSEKGTLEINTTIENAQTENDSDFDEFSSYISVKEEEKQPDLEINNKQDTTFSTSEDVLNSSVEKITNLNNVNDDEDDFGEFVFETNVKKVTVEDDFDDFADFTSARTLEVKQTPPIEKNDEFSDFSSWEQSQKVEETAPKFDVDFGATLQEHSDDMNINEDNAFERAESILKEIYHVEIEEVEDHDCKNLDEIIKIDPLYNQIEDFTQAHALKFQYGKSQCREILLNALNIDVRNIFPGMPRFAANLGPTPLEPIKSDAAAPTLAPKQKQDLPATSIQAKLIEVPNAQFDWSGSGLQNPLDSVTANGPLPSPQPQVSNVNLQPVVEQVPQVLSNGKSKSDLEVKESSVLDDFSDFTSHPPLKIESNKDSIVTVPEIDRNEQIEDDFSDFTSHHSEIQPPHAYNVVLRETHISSNTKLSLENVEQDDFDDFQVAVPEQQSTNDIGNILSVKSTESNSSKIDYDTQKILEKLSQLKRKASTGSDQIQIVPTTPIESSVIINQSEVGRKSLNNESISLTNKANDIPTSFLPKQQEMPQVNSVSQKANDEDDEFTEFHSFDTPQSILPTPVSLQPQSVSCILEPLKPAVVTAQSVQHKDTNIMPVFQNQGQISWPDPGITDDDIRNFELSYSRVPEVPKSNAISKGDAQSRSNIERKIPHKSKNESKHIHTKVIKTSSEPKKVPSKQNSYDDEWSDFVSVQKTSPIHKLQEKERSSTPDLPLSVLNLSHVQPAKKPIPLITSQGLIQTKLSSSMISPVAQNNVKVMQPKVEQLPYQPSIISNQFASHMMNGFHSVPIRPTKSAQQSSQGDNDDVEWTEFVSHETSSSAAKKVPINQNLTRYGSWTGATPNIITNPVSFDSNFNRQPPRGMPNVSAQQAKKYGLSNIAVPELGFAAPKSRTTHRK